MTGLHDGTFIEHLFRRQTGQIVSWLVGRLGPRHLQLAEDAVQESMLRAMQAWRFEGLPANPEAWLFRVAHNYAISALRHGKFAELSLAEVQVAPVDPLPAEQSLRDDELRMIFLCCHTDLPESARVTLSLKLVGGFSVAEIAGLFLIPETTVAQRIVRAKKVFRERSLSLSLPSADELRRRLDSVLEAIYLIFSAGYTALSGEDLVRNDICSEALRLGRLIADSSIASPRSDALLALMSLLAARSPARSSAAGELVLLEEQDRGLWNGDLIQQGFRYFERSVAGEDVSVWHVQAAINALYIRAGTPDATDWSSILQEYDFLAARTNSPLVLLNRAVAVAKVHGDAAALSELQALADEAVLAGYYLFHSVRGHLLMRLGQLFEAEAAYLRALECNCSSPEKRFLQSRLAEVRQQVEAKDR